MLDKEATKGSMQNYDIEVIPRHAPRIEYAFNSRDWHEAHYLHDA